MIVRICPYCDQKMTKKHHCDNCGSFVWKANIVNTEQKYSSQGGDSWQPETADAEKYAAPEEKYAAPEEKYAAAEEKYAAPEQAYVPPEEKYAAPEQAYVPPEQKYMPKGAAVPAKKSPERPSNTGSKLAAALVIAIIVIGVMGGVVFSVGSSVSDYGDDSDSWDEWEDDSWTDLSYGDISDYTENCTAYEHLDIDGEALTTATEDFLLEKGYSPDESSRDFSGYHETEPHDEISYSWNYGVRLGESGDEAIYISYDAVTGDVHNINMAISSKEDAVDYILMVLRDFMGGDAVQASEIEPLFDEETGGWAYYKNCEISVYASSYFDGYNINMDATTEPFDYAQEPEVQEIPMEKIQEVGQECNTAAHMDISRDEAVLAIENWLEENGWTGYQFANEYASNMIQTYSQLGGEKYERLTLNTVDAWYSDKDSTSMMIESDSYSGRVHMIYASGFSINEVSPVILCVVQAAGVENGEEIAELSLAQVEGGGYAFTEFDGLKLYVSAYDDDTCTIQLYALD